MKYILYGAGRRGEKVLNMLVQHNMEVLGFCDSNKSGNVVMNGINEFPIYSIEQIKEDKDRENITIIISIANNVERIKAEKMIGEAGIPVATIEEVLYGSTDDKVKNNRKYIAEYHVEEMDDYYDYAESKAGIEEFWSKTCVFYEMFVKLDLEKVVELACGRGRHVSQYIDKANEIVLVDILEKNINFCKERFKNEPKVHYYVNDGYDLKDLKSNSYTSVFSYDAMVHFEMFDVFSYLKEIERILKPGGMALLHHSNNAEDYRVTFSTGTNGRNYMSINLFAYLANRACLEVMEQKAVDWAGVKEIDGVTLLRKPCCK